MWTKRNDHAPKLNVLIFLIYVQKKGQFWKISSLTSLLSCRVFIFSTPIKKIKIITSLLCHGPLPFFYQSTSFVSLHCKTRGTMLTDNASLKTYRLATSNSTVTLTFFPWCKWSRPGTSSTTNHKFYRAVVQLHGPWCEQPATRRIPPCRLK